MYKDIVIATRRSYGQAEAYIYEELRKHNLAETDRPRVVPIEATQDNPRYYNVVIRDHVTSTRRW